MNTKSDTKSNTKSDTRTKAQRFSDVANRRLSEVLDGIRLFGQCSNTGNYEYTQEQVAKAFALLRSEIDAAEAKYKAEGKQTRKSLI